jgi:hypothetical protein
MTELEAHVDDVLTTIERRIESLHNGKRVAAETLAALNDVRRDIEMMVHQRDLERDASISREIHDYFDEPL